MPNPPNLPSDLNKPSNPVADYLEKFKAGLPAAHPARAAITVGDNVVTGTAYGVRGRLIFALDATASRQPTWDQACRIQGEMFEATASLGGLDTKLVYFRGFDECKASRWLTTAHELHAVMSRVSCVGGLTQIARVLDHAIAETTRVKTAAVIFVGDAMEEKIDVLCDRASQLGALNTPVFVFP